MTPDTRGIRAFLLDIEGTTTPITFVYDVLFPFARRELPGFLRAHAEAARARVAAESWDAKADLIADEFAAMGLTWSATPSIRGAKCAATDRYSFLRCGSGVYR